MAVRADQRAHADSQVSVYFRTTGGRCTGQPMRATAELPSCEILTAVAGGEEICLDMRFSARVCGRRMRACNGGRQAVPAGQPSVPAETSAP